MLLESLVGSGCSQDNQLDRRKLVLGVVTGQGDATFAFELLLVSGGLGGVGSGCLWDGRVGCV